MNKIYLGETEVANVGSGGGGGGVSDASFNELARVTASALLDLKGLEDNIEEFDDKIEGHVETIDTQIQTLDTNKADSSVVYTKKDIDNADKVSAAALASLNDRVSELEEGGGGGITPAQLDASLKEYTYDKAYLDASFSAIDINPISEILTDVSTRVDALEDANFIDSAQLDVSLKEYAYSKSYVDASIQAIDASIVALDASALSFDASIKELAEGGGGGSFDPSDINASIGDISTRVKAIEDDYVVTNDISAFVKENDISTYYKKNDKIVCFGELNTIYNNKGYYFVSGTQNKATNGRNGPIVCLGTENTITTKDNIGFYTGIVIGESNTVNQYGYCIGEQNDIQDGGYAFGYHNNVKQEYAVAVGVFNTTGKKTSVITGIRCQTSNFYEVATGYYNKTSRENDTSTHFSIGNGASDSSRHNAFEVRRSGDIYVADVSAAGEYYEKPMINLQQKIYELEARLAALENA